MPENNLTTQEIEKLNYPGDLTLEALSVIDTYRKMCCNKAATARQLNKTYQKVYQLLKQPYVRDLFKLKLIEKGITPDRIAESIDKGIDAQNGIYYEGGKVNEEPNWAARQKFTQLACEILEVLKYGVKVENNMAAQNIQVVINKYQVEDVKSRI